MSFGSGEELAVEGFPLDKIVAGELDGDVGREEVEVEMTNVD